MKRGLVLEGGGMRGLFSEGFIDVMQEEGITVDGMIGVSAGALFGCNFKSHQVGRGLRYNTRFKDDPRYMGWRSFITTGNFVNAQFAYHTMPMELDVFDIPAFEADPTEFYLACTDIKTGKPVYQQIDHVEDSTLEWFRATGSMPIRRHPTNTSGSSRCGIPTIPKWRNVWHAVMRCTMPNCNTSKNKLKKGMSSSSIPTTL